MRLLSQPFSQPFTWPAVASPTPDIYALGTSPRRIERAATSAGDNSAAMDACCKQRMRIRRGKGQSQQFTSFASFQDFVAYA